MLPRALSIALILTLSTFLIPPTYAHTTMGDLNGGAPFFRSNDNELNPTNTFGRRHVPGPLGYIWPGSGLNAYTNIASYPPGYQSPFTTYEQPLQVAGDSYSPEGAILTSTTQHDSVGDLILAINFSDPTAFITTSNPRPNFIYNTVTLYVPAPVVDKAGRLLQDGFEPTPGINWSGGDNSNIATTITNDYADILVGRAGGRDAFSPSDWLIFINATIRFTAANHYSEWYYVRLNQIRAPEIAGRYLFKIFLNDAYPIHRQEAPASGSALATVNETMPMENWPTLLVKGEVDPEIIYGTVRYGLSGNTSLYSLPLHVPGRVRALGVAIDPLTGRSTGRPVEAEGYFNASSQGHFEVEGVAAGVYTVYAAAAGFPEQLVAKGIIIHRGQGLKLDAYLNVGLAVQGEVFSKASFGVSPWPAQRPISIVIYSSNLYDERSIITSSPINLTQAPFSSYVHGNTLFTGSGLIAPNTPKEVAFPWEGPGSYYGHTLAPTYKDPFGIFNGVGPAESWWVNPTAALDPVDHLGSTSTSFIFQFGSPGVFGVPANFTGRVPQIFATWSGGLNPGRYYLRAFVNGYVQTNNAGTLLLDYPFDVPDVGHSRGVFIPIDLQQSSTIVLTVHLHNLPGTLGDSPVLGPDPSRILIAEAFSRGGAFAAFNFTQVTASGSTARIYLNGFGMAGPLQPPDKRALIKYSLVRYRGIYDYGLPTDTYLVRVYMRGYIQAAPPASSISDLDRPLVATVTAGGSLVVVSTQMYRGGEINATVFSEDWQKPPVLKRWVWGNAPLSVLVYDIPSAAFIDVIYFWNSINMKWTLPTQNTGFTIVPYSGWKSLFGSGASLLVTNGSVLVDRFGPDLPTFPSPDQSQAFSTTIFLEDIFLEGFLYTASNYRSASFMSNIAIYPGTYTLNAWTYGYVQPNVRFVGDLGNVHLATSSLGSLGKVSIPILQGVNFTIRTVFKTEGVYAPTPYTMASRIRVFDQGDNIVAAAPTSFDAGRLITNSRAGFFHDGRKAIEQPIPAGTQTLEYQSLSGLYQYIDPGPQNTRFGVRSQVLFFADHGIWGSSFYSGAYYGSWLVMIDFVNWSQSNSFYPPVPALLQGESPYFFPYNHLGPYQEESYFRIPNAALGSEASLIFEVDLRAYVQGLVLGFNLANQLRTVSWARLSISGTTAPSTYYWYTWDGWFDGYLNPGSYRTTVVEWSPRNEGHNHQEIRISATPGQADKAFTIILEESGIPIPEYPSLNILLAIGIIVAVACLELKKRFRRQPRMG